ncbi:MAG: response regulator [Anaerolineae bacterium]|nr:response regulator [Anaerolineae bacterium]
MDTPPDPQIERLVRDALAHLYDFAYLQRHPLAARLVPPQGALARTRGQELRRVLLDAIEALNPGPNVPIRAIERRPYAILFGLYVEGRPLPEVASSLGIGGRQLRRDRAAAIAALAGLLRDRHLRSSEADVSGGAREPLREESERLAQGREPVDLGQLVDGLLPLLEGVARDHGAALGSRIPASLPQPITNRTLVRQVLIGLASQALANLPLARLTFAARTAEGAVAVGLRITYRVEAGGGTRARLSPQLGSVQTLAQALGGELQHEPGKAREEAVWLVLPLQDRATVLVVDDNQELFALFERYVAGEPYHLVHAASADEALALVRSVRPEVITVDLMMPRRDGWELLQALRSGPQATSAPIIVCSVLDESQLALSLGAQACLRKPVGQAELLQALRMAQGRAGVGAERPGSPAGSRGPD